MQILKKLVFILFIVLTLIKTYAVNYYINDASTSGDIYCSYAYNSSNHQGTAINPSSSFDQLLTDIRTTLQPGDIVYIDAGTYNWTSSISPNGSGVLGNLISIQGAGVANTIITVANTYGINSNDKNYIKVDGIDLKSSTSTLCFFSGLSQWWTISNNKFEGTSQYGIYFSANANCNNHTINNVTINTSGQNCIYSGTGVNNITVSNCTLTTNTHVVSTTSGTSYFTFSNCTVSNTSGYGFNLGDNTSHYTFSNNTVNIASGKGINFVATSSYITITDGHSATTGDDVVNFTGDVNYVTINNATLTSTNNAVIRFSGNASHVTISNSSFTTNSSGAEVCFVNAGSWFDVSNTSFTNSGSGKAFLVNSTGSNNFSFYNNCSFKGGIGNLAVSIATNASNYKFLNCTINAPSIALQILGNAIGFTISNSTITSTSNNGVSIATGATNFTISNNTINSTAKGMEILGGSNSFNITNTTVVSSGGTGVEIDGNSSNYKIDSCTFTSATDKGLYTTASATYYTISNTTISGNIGDGALVLNSNATGNININHCTISNNYGNNGYGLVLRNATQNCTVSDNTFNLIKPNSIYMKAIYLDNGSGNITIDHNTINLITSPITTPNYGVYINTSNNDTIRRNIINNGNIGVLLTNGGGTGISIYNNQMSNLTQGISCATASFSGVTCYNNSIYSTNECIIGQLNGWNIKNNILSTTTNLASNSCLNIPSYPPSICNYNLYNHPTLAKCAYLNAVPYQTVNDWKNKTNSNDQNSLDLDPLFQGASTNNLQLVSNSPAIAAGTAITAVPKDIVLTSRNTSPTIGAYEYTKVCTLTVNINSQTNVLCKGDSSGLVSITANGVSPYTYSWSNNKTTQNLVHLVAGNYTITVKDNNNCTASATAIITQPALALSITAVNNSPVCVKQSLSLNVSPTASTYSWSGPNNYISTSKNPTISASATTFLSGIYTVTVKDVNNCSATASTIITVNSCGQPTTYYINDNSTTGDSWCTAPGNDATGNGSNTAPYSTLSYVLAHNTLKPGDTVLIDNGNYSWPQVDWNVSGTLDSNIVVSGAGNNKTFITGTNGNLFDIDANYPPYSYLTFKNMNLTGAPGNSIFYFYQSSYCTVKNNIITATGDAFSAIDLFNSAQHNLFLNNTITITGNSRVAIYFEQNPQSYTSIIGNKFNSTSTNPNSIAIWNSQMNVTNCVISNNYIANFVTGFELDQPNNTDFKIDYNSFYCKSRCIYVGQSTASSFDIRNNIFYTSAAGSACLFINPNDQPNLDYNLYYSPNGVVAFYNQSNYPALTDWKAYNGWAHDSHSQTGSPLFTNVATGDLSILSGSPAQGKGIAIATFPKDINDTLRKNQSTIGAFEYVFCNLSTSVSSNSPVCTNNTLTLTNSSTQMCSYSWSGPNNFTSTIQNPIITNSTTSISGIYSVTVTDVNRCTAKATTTVTIQACIPQTYYVNDTSRFGDSWCSAIGNDSTGNGSRTKPYATLSYVLNKFILNTGDTLFVDAGYYSDAKEIIFNEFSRGACVFGSGIGNTNYTCQGIKSNGATAITISNISVYNTNTNDFTIDIDDGSTNWKILNCYVTQTGSNQASILLNGANNTIKGCTIKSNRDGIFEYISGNYNIIDNNIIICNNTSFAGISTYGNNNDTIRNNRISGGQFGIYTDGTSPVNNNIIFNNNIYNTNVGIYTTNNVTNTKLYYNSIYSTSSCIIGTQLGWDIKNNILYTTSSSLSDYCFVNLDYLKRPITLDYNLYYHPNGAQLVMLNLTYNTLPSLQSASFELHGIEADPNFIYPSYKNFSIDQTSNAFASAYLISWIKTDINNATRKQISDIGAFEFPNPKYITINSVSLSNASYFNTVISSNTKKYNAGGSQKIVASLPKVGLKKSIQIIFKQNDSTVILNTIFNVDNSANIDSVRQPVISMIDSSKFIIDTISLNSKLYKIDSISKLSFFSPEERINYDFQNIDFSSIIQPLLQDGVLLTPNNDGVYDSFVVNGLTNISNYSLKIFNLNGNIIYQTTNKTDVWNCTDASTGSLLPPSAYKYVIKADDKIINGQFMIEY